MSVTTVEITTIEQVSNLLWTNEFEEDKKRFRSNAVFEDCLTRRILLIRHYIETIKKRAKS